MTAALAAVGAAVIGGLQLTELGAIEGTNRILAAAIGGTAALLGVIAAVMVTVSAMLPRSTSVEDLGDVERNPEKQEWLANWLTSNRGALLRHDKDTVVALVSDYKASLRELRTAFDEHFDDPDSPVKEQRAKVADEHTKFLNGIIYELIQHAKLAQAKRGLRASRATVAVAALVIAAGMYSFVWGASAPDKPAVDMRGANLTGAKLNDAELRGAKLDKMKIEGADLTGTYLGDASIEETEWVKTVCPDGVLSDNAGGTCAGHLKP
jgi:hypothetical protein